MSARLAHCRRRRVRLVWLTLAVLLLQQLALAAHACVLMLATAVVTTSQADPHPCEPDPLPGDALCAEHCSPVRAAAAEPAPVTLPLWLPAPPSAPLVALRPPPTAFPHAPGQATAGPPPIPSGIRLLI